MVATANKRVVIFLPLEYIPFRLWKLVVSLLVDDSIDVKTSMAAGLSKVFQVLTHGEETTCMLMPNKTKHHVLGILKIRSLNVDNCHH